MSRISERISKIRYQIIKNLDYQLTDEQLILAVQSLYDSLINADTLIPSNTIMPTEALGVNLIWNGTTSVTMSKGSYSLEDDFTDDVKPEPEDFQEEIPFNSFTVNGRNFQTNEYYFVTNPTR